MLYLLSGKDLQNEGRSSWSLRSRSKIIATVGVVYGLTVIAVSMAPGSWPVTPRKSAFRAMLTVGNISWSPVILVGTVLVCLITWKCYGKCSPLRPSCSVAYATGVKHYSGPIRAVTKWETGIEIDLQSAIASQRSRPSNNRSSQRVNPEDSAGSAGKPDKAHDSGNGGSHVVVEPAGSLERDSNGSGEAAGIGPTVTLQDTGTRGTTTGTDMTGSEWTSGTETGWTDETVSRGTIGRGTRSIP